MQVVHAVVRGELEGPAVEREAGVGDAIAESTDDGAEVARLGEIVPDAVEPQDDIVDAAAAIRRAHRDDRRAVGHRADLDAAAVGQREGLD